MRVLNSLAEAGEEAYRAFVYEQPGFFDYWHQATPIDELAMMPIGSRPAKRGTGGFTQVRAIPWVLNRIAHTKSRELFILVVLAITLGTAMGASELFGVSLALGAFVAGAIISQSHLSHQVGADVFAFREAFSVLFFVSVGMLVNPSFLWANIGQVAALTSLVVIGKGIIVITLGLFSTSHCMVTFRPRVMFPLASYENDCPPTAVTACL